MLELFFAYFIAATLIAGMVAFALRNQKQGWRRQRDFWRPIQSSPAPSAFEARLDPPLQHLNELLSLQQSLAHQSELAQKEQLTSSR